MRPSEQLRAELTRAEGIVLLEDRGESATRLAELRRRCRRVGVGVRAVRTQLLRQALLDTPFAVLHESCRGQLLVLTAGDGAGEAARVAHGAQSERLHVRACAIPGELVELADMAALPSRAATRASLLGSLRAIPTALLVTFGDRCDELAIVNPSPDRLFVPLADLQALRRRLSAHLEVPESRNDYVGTWTECTIDTDALFGELAGVWLRPGWRLRAYAYRVGSNGNGVVWALPPEAPDPAPLGTIRGSLHYPPRPAGARSCREALAGDGSLLSYMHASILIRELGEFGALWHGVSWGAHQLIEWLPAGEPWKFELRLPWRLGPRVVRHDDAVSVVFHSVNHECVVRLLRHVDYYPWGEYQVWRGEIEAARGGPGYIP